MKRLIFFISFAIVASACYDPAPFEAESLDVAKSQTSKIGTIYPINTKKQVCNPSVSRDTVNYPGSLLWLNFGGKLNVDAPDKEYTTSGVYQHDRLSIADTSNKVKWFLMVDPSLGECQFQDPEWTTHPDFLVALRGYDLDGKANCENLDYGIFAVRTADKKKFWFYDKNIIEEATPHVWVDPNAVPDLNGDPSTVEGFFGTKNVKLTYVNADREIVLVDYSNGGTKKAKTLKKPADRKDWRIDSPLISADGKFVVYNMVENSTSWEAYIQELSDKSEAKKIEKTNDMISNPAQPHWFEFAGRTFVLWAELPSGSEMLLKVDFTNESVQDGSVGRTVMREIMLNGDAATEDMKMEWVGENREVASIPMFGGRSPDGRFLATGTNYTFILRLP